MIARRQEKCVKSILQNTGVHKTEGLDLASYRIVSRSGACFDAIPGICVGDIVEFACEDVKPLTGVVNWVKDGRFGVSVVLEDFAHAQSPQQLRTRSVRLPLQFEAHVFINGSCTSVKAHNLSLRDVCVQEAPEMRAGKRISVDIAGVAFERATVRWCQGGYAGVSFAEPMTRHQYNELADRLQEPAGPRGVHILSGHVRNSAG